MTRRQSFEAARGDAMPFGAGALFVRQRVQTASSLRGHPAGSGMAAPLVVGNAATLRTERETAPASFLKYVVSLAVPLHARRPRGRQVAYKAR